MRIVKGEQMLDVLANAFSSAAMETGLLFTREDVFDTVGWVVAGCNPSGAGWLIRCNDGEVLAVECSGVRVVELVGRLESILVKPMYDDSSAILDGFVFFCDDRAEWSSLTIRGNYREGGPPPA